MVTAWGAALAEPRVLAMNSAIGRPGSTSLIAKIRCTTLMLPAYGGDEAVVPNTTVVTTPTVRPGHIM